MSFLSVILLDWPDIAEVKYLLFVYFRDDTIITPEYHWYVCLTFVCLLCLQCVNFLKLKVLFHVSLRFFKKVIHILNFFDYVCLQTDANINELLNTLECPVCLDTADSPPIFQCPEGHLLCQRCNQRLVDCPQCGHALMNSRNRIAEDLAIKLQVRFNLRIFTAISCWKPSIFQFCSCF